MNVLRALLGRIFPGPPAAIASDPEAQRPSQHNFVAGCRMPAPLRYCAWGTASLSFTLPTQPAVDHYVVVPQPTLQLGAITPQPTSESGPTEPENRAITGSDVVWAYRGLYAVGAVLAVTGATVVLAVYS